MMVRSLASALLLCGIVTASWPASHTARWEPIGVSAAGRLSHPPARCKGSTRAKVRVHWPNLAEGAVARQVGWSTSVPQQIGRWAYLIVPAARANGLDPFLVAAIMRIESNGDPLAWNLDSDAHGLMQVLHAPFDPTTNVRLGVSMLGDLRRQYPRQDLLLAAYNAGPGAVQQYGGVPPYPETQAYVVMVAYWRDKFAGVNVPPSRLVAYKRAEANVRAFIKRVCGRR